MPRPEAASRDRRISVVICCPYCPQVCRWIRAFDLCSVLAVAVARRNECFSGYEVCRCQQSVLSFYLSAAQTRPSERLLALNGASTMVIAIAQLFDDLKEKLT